MSEHAPLLEAYLDGELDDQGFVEFNDWLREDPEHLRQWVIAAFMSRELGVALSEQANTLDQPVEMDQTAATQRGLMDAEVLDLLQEIEATGEDIDPMQLAAERFGAKPDNNPTKHDYAEAAQYIFEHALANKRLLYTAGSAVAAVLLIALSLVFIFSGGPDEPVGDPLADVTLWDTPTPRHLPVVATLTDAVGAQWRSDDKPVPMPMGAQLVAFERYTLTHGFAEITTRRGATALLQAPCTIELTDHDNAIRLHDGKLVGKCETPSSKGFIVHAPDMDVIDLGTEFGVEADAAEGSTVLVMTGEVRAQPTEQSPLAFTPVVLRKDQARQIVPETGGLGLIAASEAPIFYEDVPHPYVTTILDAAPVAYWRFEDDANRTITNEVGQNKSDLKIVGPAQLTDEGVIGKAGLLHNRNQPYAFFETKQPVEALNGLDEYTVELWYYTNERYEMARDNSTASVFNLFDPYQGNDHENASEAWLVSLELTNDFWADKDEDFILTQPPSWREFSIRNVPLSDLATKEHREIYTAQDYPIARWQHLVMVRTKDGVKLYLDGELAEEAAYTPPMINSAGVRLGRSVLDVIQKFDPDSPYTEGLYRPLRGRLDEVALYDKVLTAEQIHQHYELATSEDSP